MKHHHTRTYCKYITAATTAATIDATIFMCVPAPLLFPPRLQRC